MGGAWRVYRRGERSRRSTRRAWLVLRTSEHEVVQFDGPVLELLTDGRARSDPRLAALGPDILAEEFDEAAYLRRLRAEDPTRGIGDALLDQRTIAGIGNLWKAEACWDAGIDPWRALQEVDDAEVLAVVEAARARMGSAALRGHRDRDHRVYGRAGLPCRRCGGRIRARGQGDDDRRTYWCPACQR
jgi:endonuclease-8